MTKIAICWFRFSWVFHLMSSSKLRAIDQAMFVDGLEGWGVKTSRLVFPDADELLLTPNGEA